MEIDTRNAVVVVPTFNEADNIPKLVETVFGLYPEIHLLVVDDQSADGTAEIVRGLQACHPKLELLARSGDPSFGRSYRDGFRQLLAKEWCQAIITMDADFSHDPVVIARLLELAGTNDVVLGSRYVASGSVGNWALGRRLLSRAANFYVRAVLGLPIRDVTSGFTCMRAAALAAVPLDAIVSDGYAFLVELKYMLVRQGCRVRESPIRFEERREGQSKMSMGKIWESVWLPWRIRFGGAGGAARGRLP
ncbi:MAG: polyprenol monophosphomannose synthase [Bryobacteraceae bacterium]